MGTTVLIIIAFLLAGGLIVLELFIPSNGVLTIAAAACLIYGIVNCFLVSQWLGFVVTIITVTALPVFIVVMVRVWPDTWIGKRIAIRKAQKAMPGGSIPDVSKLDKLAGGVGETITDLRPVGVVMFGSDRVDCVAETGQIEKGLKVTVIRVEGVRVVVREQT
jgi:membrane-bound serine protease (ClpP class)